MPGCHCAVNSGWDWLSVVFVLVCAMCTADYSGSELERFITRNSTKVRGGRFLSSVILTLHWDERVRLQSALVSPNMCMQSYLALF